MSDDWKAAKSCLETKNSAGVPPSELGESSRLLAAHLDEKDLPNKPLVMPIHHTSTYKISDVEEYLKILKEGGFIYQRLLHPNGQDAECRINSLEGGYGTLAFNTGMSCMVTILTGLLKSGDHVICQNPVYSAVHYYVSKVMPKFGVSFTWVKAGSPIKEFEKMIKPNTKMIIGESPSNPLIDVMDLEEFGKLGKKHGIITIVDATYASPVLLKPIKFGIDIAWHSATKYMGGHSDSMGGVLTCQSEELFKKLQVHRAHSGTNISPSEAAILSRGLRTLPCRMRIHCENGQAVAEYLDSHPKISKVFYPGLKNHPGHQTAAKQMNKGFGGMMSFEMKDGFEAAKKIITNVKLISLAVSLGGVESLIQHPASMTHGPMIMNDEERKTSLITDGQIRLSVGIEDKDDLIRDLRMALDKV